VKYLLITNDFFPNGIGGMTHYYTGLAEGLGRDRVIVLTIQAGQSHVDEPEVSVFRANVHSDSSGSYLSKLKIKAEALKIITKYSIDVILCGNVRPYGDIAFDIHKKTGVPYFIFFHGNDLLRILDRMKRYWYKRYSYGLMLKYSEGFVANSRYVLDLIPDRFKREKPLFVVNPGINRGYEHQPIVSPFQNTGNIRLLTVARLDRRKGVSKVLEAMALLKDRFPNLVYDVVGAGDQGPYRCHAKSLGIEERVHFHGFKSYSDVMELFKTADIFMMVSYASDSDLEVEGFGIVFLEAGAFGKPVIGSLTGGIQDAVLDGKTGILVKNPFDEVEIADAISWLCLHTEQAVFMGVEAHQQIGRAHV
jgi:phosphatidylinositol alpha-1,6-mannosyltransferase